MASKVGYSYRYTYYKYLLLVIVLLLWSLLVRTTLCDVIVNVDVNVDGEATDTDTDTDTDNEQDRYPQTCYSWTGSSCDWEPNLHEMTVQYGNGIYNETFNAYIIPDVSTFYNATKGTKTIKKPKFNGLFGKFINMSPNTVRVHWDSGRKGAKLSYLADIEPFGSAGTATYPNHKFVVTPSNNENQRLIEWTITADNSLYYYDPFDNNPEKAKKALTNDQYHLYFIQIQTRAFAIQYRKFTGIDYLALYKYKHPPRYHMWRADYINQVHTITTEEIHYVKLPPDDEIQRSTSVYGPRPDEIGRMRKYRHQLPTLDLQLKVLSCAPRVFEIQNFLSDLEVDHILQIAHNISMQRSSTRAGEAALATSSDETRTSKNTWISRNHNMIIDSIHRRAANVLQINESLLRWRRTSEIPEMSDESVTTIAERLQLVHYDVGQRKFKCKYLV
jgi:hypothetical protein